MLRSDSRRLTEVGEVLLERDGSVIPDIASWHDFFLLSMLGYLTILVWTKSVPFI